MELLKQARGDQLKADTQMYQKIFTDLGITKGRVMVYGKSDSGVMLETTRSKQQD